MISSFISGIFFSLFFLVPDVNCSGDQCRHLAFRAEQAFEGKRLINHVIRTHDVMMADFCGALCYMEHNCASYNLMRRSEAEGHKCELNNSTHEAHENDLEEDPSFVYRGTKSTCVSNPCENNSTCQTGFTDKGYRCLCTAGFHGHECQNDADECTMSTHDCSANAVCNNTKGSYSCMCTPGFSGDGRQCEDIDECALGTHDCSANAVCNNSIGSYVCSCISGYFGDGLFCKSSPCKELYDKNLDNGNKAYLLTLGSDTIPVYCHMTADLGACGGGGWTLVMKMNGKQQNFHYGSNLWSNKETFNVAGGETGFDFQETKLPTYWNTSFSKICLGMKISLDDQTDFIVIDKQANSLYSLIADGQYRATSLGRDTWKTLIGSQASMQRNCNKEGFNARISSGGARARIGLIANNENDCSSCNSRIGFGTGGSPDDSNSCGNAAQWSSDNGDVNVAAMGYIFVQ
ncbi:uncharacterized protein LOC144636339 [Oculina patagonica]